MQARYRQVRSGLWYFPVSLSPRFVAGSCQRTRLIATRCVLQVRERSCVYCRVVPHALPNCKLPGAPVRACMQVECDSHAIQATRPSDAQYLHSCVLMPLLWTYFCSSRLWPKALFQDFGFYMLLKLAAEFERRVALLSYRRRDLARCDMVYGTFP